MGRVEGGGAATVPLPRGTHTGQSLLSILLLANPSDATRFVGRFRYGYRWPSASLVGGGRLRTLEFVAFTSMADRVV